jgi:hypothetical protein
LSSLIATAVDGMRSFGKTNSVYFAAFTSLPKDVVVKKLDDIDVLSESLFGCIAKKVAEGKPLFGVSWLQAAARGTFQSTPFSLNVQNLMLNCVSASLEHVDKKTSLSPLMKEFTSVLPQLEHRLLKGAESRHSILKLLAKMIVKVPQNEITLEFIDVICSCLFGLPSQLFDEKCIQQALRHMFQSHFEMEPVWYLSCVFRGNQGTAGANIVTSQLRALAISQSFLNSVVESESPQSSERAIVQVCYSLPLWLSLLENSNQVYPSSYIFLITTHVCIRMISFLISLFFSF